MDDRREEIRRLVGSLTYMSNVEGEMAAEHGAPMYAGLSPAGRGVLNGYLRRAKQLCAEDSAIQELEPLDAGGWYGEYHQLLRALEDLLSAELNTLQAGNPS